MSVMELLRDVTSDAKFKRQHRLFPLRECARTGVWRLSHRAAYWAGRSSARRDQYLREARQATNPGSRIVYVRLARDAHWDYLRFIGEGS
jgi:hypothetical protein